MATPHHTTPFSPTDRLISYVGREVIESLAIQYLFKKIIESFANRFAASNRIVLLSMNSLYEFLNTHTSAVQTNNTGIF
jgi:hypothetical protein